MRHNDQNMPQISKKSYQSLSYLFCFKIYFVEENSLTYFLKTELQGIYPVQSLIATKLLLVFHLSDT